MLKFIREEKWEEIVPGQDPVFVVCTVVAEEFMGYDTIVGYILKTDEGYKRVWEWWL
jgi:hypothetical protein